MASRVTKWDMETDVVVMGSGGAGLTAAIMAADQGARVVVIERSNKVGGTTAVSGGILWIPMQQHAAELGVEDSREEALTYCKRLTNGRAPDELVETFVDTGHQMVRYLEERTPVKLRNWPIPDDFPHHPGAKQAGRAIEPELFDTNELGEWQDKLRPAPIFVLPVLLAELLGTRMQDLPFDVIAKRMEKGMVGMGRALAGRLLKGCLDRGVTVLLETRGRQLVQEDGRIAGLRAEHQGRDYFLRANGGVVMASGGFEWNEDLRLKFLPGRFDLPASPPHNEGDALVMAMEVGADLANVTEVWGGGTVTIIPGEEYDGKQLGRLMIPSGLSHRIMVDRQGRRFYNEATSHHDVLRPFIYSDLDFKPMDFGYRGMPIWTVFDHQYREEYPILTVMPDEPDPAWLIADETIEGLAEKTGIDPTGLRETVERYNRFAREGKDEDYGRGTGLAPGIDTDQVLGTIEKPPFYAMRLYPCVLGTKGGPRTNIRGQVLNVRGEVIPGLYAAGNAMASVTGESYYGNGATIGTGMTFGYICGINVGQEARAAQAASV